MKSAAVSLFSLKSISLRAAFSPKVTLVSAPLCKSRSSRAVRPVRFISARLVVLALSFLREVQPARLIETRGFIETDRLSSPSVLDKSRVLKPLAERSSDLQVTPFRSISVSWLIGREIISSLGAAVRLMLLILLPSALISFRLVQPSSLIVLMFDEVQFRYSRADSPVRSKKSMMLVPQISVLRWTQLSNLSDFT